NASDTGADLDLYVFDCHTGSCVLRGSSTSGSANEFVSIANPAAGQWIVLVDPFAVPAGSTTYDELHVVSNPAFGPGRATDPPAGSCRASSRSRAARPFSARPRWI